MADRLQFFSRSYDEIAGIGAGEHVLNRDDFSPLNNINNWRRILSNFHVLMVPIIYNGLTFNTLEHAFQYAKINLASPQIARQFALESGSALSRSDGKPAQGQRKCVILSADQITHWDIIKGQLMADFLEQKFTNDAVCRDVLIKTRNAQLWHSIRRGAERWYHLEDIRAAINQI